MRLLLQVYNTPCLRNLPEREIYLLLLPATFTPRIIVEIKRPTAKNVATPSPINNFFSRGDIIQIQIDV